MGQEQLLPEPNREKHTTEDKNAVLRYCCVGMQGWRGSMEDSHITHLDIKEGFQLFGVFDGHGGKGTALYTGKYFKEILLKEEAWAKGDYKKALQDTCYKIDDNMRLKEIEGEIYYLENPDHKEYPLPEITRVKSGATATIVLITPDEIICGNAGDARTICSKNGTAVALSEDHKPDDEAETARVEAAGQQVDKGRVGGVLAVSRSLGDFDFKGESELPPEEQAVTSLLDFTVTPRSEVDFIFMACDGIYDVRRNQDIVKHIVKEIYSGNYVENIGKADLKQGLEDFMDECCPDVLPDDKKGSDNMSAMIIELNK